MVAAPVVALLLLPACEPAPPPPLPGGDAARLFSPPSSGFEHVSSYDTTGGNRDRHEVAPGDSVVLLDLQGPGVVRRMWMTVASRDPHYLRRIALEMYWDGEVEPSVRVPLGDFFGNAFDRRHYAALPMGVSSGGFFSYLPMPFARGARIVARNGTGLVIDAFYFNADVERVRALPEPLATFHAAWNRDPRTTTPSPHRVLSARGAGHFVGMSLVAESHDGSLFFLEGDESFVVDGEARGQGTGTEDYFNAGWYFDQGPFAAPYHGLVVKDDALGRIAAYRWHLPDPVPFADSVRIELEHGHANEEVVDMATTAYWYQTEPHAPLPPLPEPDARRVLAVKIPEGAVVGDDLGAVPAQTGGYRVTVPLSRPDRYEVWVYEVDEIGTTLPPVVVDTVATGGPLVLDRPGTRPPAAVEPRPLRRFATDWSVVGPFPNPQRIGSELSPALDSVYPPDVDPALESAYATDGGAMLRWRPAHASADGAVRLNPWFEPNDWVVAWAQAFLWSPDERDAVLLLGADDAHVLTVNGEEVSRRQGRNISWVDDLAVPVRLEAGWNRVLLKVADLDGGWAFHLRAADPTGDLRWARTPGG
jgi:hypothetical protein